MIGNWKPDPTFYPSARSAMEAPREELAYVSYFTPNGKGAREGGASGLSVVDVDARSSAHGQIVGRLELPNAGEELHHFGWNACSASLCPNMPHPHVERRYLLVPGVRSSRMYVVDTKPDPRQPRVHKVIEPEELQSKSGYSRPHTIHCGPDAIYVNALGAPDGEGPGGIFLLDHNSFDVIGPWEKDRGSQRLAYDFWWHLGHDTMITSEWGTPNMVEDGLIPELLLGSKYGHQIHVWDLRKRTHLQALDLGSEHQMVLELRPSHNPNKTYGFVGVVTSLKDLSASVWTWYRENGSWQIRKVIEVPAERRILPVLPPILKGFGAVAPLITDINLSLDDRFLYVSCWGTGELRQYDVSDPFNPRHTGSVHIGGIVRKAGHPKHESLSGGPQMVEISRDGQRVYLTNSLYASWDAQFYPEGIKGWAAKVSVQPEGGIQLDPDFLVEFGDERPHQIRLQGGDASSDSFCYPSS